MAEPYYGVISNPETNLEIEGEETERQEGQGAGSKVKKQSLITS